jgi:hypothetical protein
MFKQIAIVSAILVMTAMIAVMGVNLTHSAQTAYAARCKGNVNVCNVQACASVQALTGRAQSNLQCSQ